MPGVVVSIMEGQLHDSHRAQLYAGAQELAPQLSVASDVPFLALGIRCHDGGMVDYLYYERSCLNSVRA